MTILKNIGNILKKDTNINFQISAIYYLVTLAYQIRLVVDSGLRRWVLQDNYLDNFQLPGKCNKAQ